MVRSFLGRVLDGLHRTGTLPAAGIKTYFKALEEQQRGLAGAALNYIAEGEASSVLAACQTPAVRQAWRQRARTWPPGDQEGLFTRLEAWRIDQMQRLGDVLAALEPLTHDWGMFGTRASPDALRHVVTLWLGRDRKDQPVATLVALSADSPDPVATALDILFCRDAQNYGAHDSVSRFAGVADWLATEHEPVTRAAPALGADLRAALAA
ncbi:hypothetical protein MTR62_20830, partial [Novosphingobium sp. 1949]